MTDPDKADPETQNRAADHRALWLCVLLVAAAVAATWPVLEMGTNDDSSYTYIARHLAETGHIAYNGWTAVILIPQLVWAAGFVKLLGFSFFAVRLSTIVLALLLAAVIYRLGRESGLRPGFAAFAALTTMLSPLTMPSTVSFMSDVPAFFLFAVCLYGAVRAWNAATARAFAGWAVLVASAGFLSGLDRQIYWLAPVLFLPILAWVRRRQGGAAVPGAAWMLVAPAIALSLKWYAAQPYTLKEDIAGGLKGVTASALLHTEALLSGQLIFTLALMLTPVLAGMVAPGLRSVPRWAAAAAIGMVAAVGLAGLHWPQLQSPLMGNVLTHYGAVPVGVVVFGEPVLVLGTAAGEAITMGVVLCCAGGAFAVWSRRDAIRAGLRTDRSPVPIMVLSAVFTAGWVPVVLVRAATSPAIDRYVIPFIALAGIPLLWFFQQHMRGVLSRASWAMLAIFTVYGIAITHDAFAGGRARLEAAEALRRAGVPRTAISAGFEYDILTQLEAVGYVNHYLIGNPKGAYREVHCTDATPWYFEFLPQVQPRYVTSRSHIPGWAGAARPISYTTWLPPARRQIFAEKIPDEVRIGCH